MRREQFWRAWRPIGGDDLETLRISAIGIQDVGRFKAFSIPFKAGVNLICGTNGVGKTTILDVAAASFVSQWRTSLRGRAGSKSPGRVNVAIERNGVVEERNGVVGQFKMQDSLDEPFGFLQYSKSVIYLKASRDFSYQRRDSVVADLQRSEANTQEQLLYGNNSAEIKQWFSNRYLFQAHSKQWPRSHVENFQLSVAAFSVLDENVKLSYVDTSSFDIIVSTPDGELPFELLSSGFRSIYSIVLGLIKEIEFRRFDLPATMFAGVVLIDEIDLHLHPSWQQRIVPILHSLFPQAQIIATTHSPHVVQTAGVGEVIALVDRPNGPKINELNVSEFGYKGWTIEEILRDVMGLHDIVSPELAAAMREFEKSVEDEDAGGARRSLSILERMLHPASHLRKLLRLQAAPVLGGRV